MGRVRDALDQSDKSQVSDTIQRRTVDRLSKQRAEPTEKDIHAAFMQDYADEYETYKQIVKNAWQAQNKGSEVTA